MICNQFTLKLQRNGINQRTAYSNKKMWWNCVNGHEYQATIAQRVSGSGCPFCSGRRAVKGVNDLKTIFPEIAKEWNYKRNIGLKPNELTAFTSKKVWWVCSVCSYEWKTSIYTHMRCGCPKCGTIKSHRSRMKSVLCVETGVEYESVSIAEKVNGIKHISDCCLGKRATAGGYHWKYKTLGNI